MNHLLRYKSHLLPAVAGIAVGAVITGTAYAQTNAASSLDELDHSVAPTADQFARSELGTEYDLTALQSIDDGTLMVATADTGNRCLLAETPVGLSAHCGEEALTEPYVSFWTESEDPDDPTYYTGWTTEGVSAVEIDGRRVQVVDGTIFGTADVAAARFLMSDGTVKTFDFTGQNEEEEVFNGEKVDS